MDGSRRAALRLAVGTAGMAALRVWSLRAQDTSQRIPATASGEPAPDPCADSKRSKTILEQNQKDIKKSIQKLFQLASELKDEVEKTGAGIMLSVAMLLKTDEIEKLARQIREKAKG